MTGIGLVTPFGIGREANWAAIRSGRSALRWLTNDDLGCNGSASACWAGAPAPQSLMQLFAEPVVGLALTAAREAYEQSGLSESGLPADRGGVVIGTSKPGLRSFGQAFRELCRPNSCRPTAFENLWLDAAGREVAKQFGWNGPLLCPVAACATGLVCVIRAAELIRSGECDAVLAGSSDASLVPIVLGSFQRLGVLARGVTDPSQACRPFDAKRSGFVIGEGAAVLVLESLAHATARGVKVIAEFITGGLASDPSGLTQVEPDGASLAWLIRDVLRRSSLSATDIDYINMHGTATRANDVAETRAVRAAFGSHADRLACSSQKGAIGHLLGAAGSVETAISLLALFDQIAPPTVNLTTPDPQCDLDYLAGSARAMRLRHVLKLSLGFGGHLAVAVFRQGDHSDPSADVELFPLRRG